MGTKVHQQSITFPNENTPYLGSVKFDFRGAYHNSSCRVLQAEKHRQYWQINHEFLEVAGESCKSDRVKQIAKSV